MDLNLEAAELAAMLVQWAGLPGAQVRRVGALHVFTGEGPAWFTQVRGIELDEAELAAALELAPTALVNVVDGLVDDELLRRCGLVPATRLLRMVAPAGEVSAGAGVDHGLSVRVVGAEAAEVVAAVADAGFGTSQPAWWCAPLGRPGWTQVVAYDGPLPVATGGLHVADGRGWIGATTTVPAARGRGAHAALLAARRRLAAQQGARRVAVKVEPGTASHRNLLRAGFADAYPLTQWVSGGAGRTEPAGEAGEHTVRPTA